MIKLAWVDNYDVAVLLSSDKDFVPVVEFLSTRGIKTIHAAFPPQGSMLSQHCWGNISIPNTMKQFRRVLDSISKLNCSSTCKTIGEGSFSDTEAGEDGVEEVFGYGLAGDFSEGGQGGGEVYCDEVVGQALG